MDTDRFRASSHLSRGGCRAASSGLSKPEYQLVLNNATVATGALIFHYDVPYADIYMETAEPLRRRGFGSYLVQELKRRAYELGSIPCARCSPIDVAFTRDSSEARSRPFCAHILNGIDPRGVTIHPERGRTSVS